jgi:hypothetical protein
LAFGLALVGWSWQADEVPTARVEGDRRQQGLQLAAARKLADCLLELCGEARLPGLSTFQTLDILSDIYYNRSIDANIGARA